MGYKPGLVVCGKVSELDTFPPAGLNKVTSNFFLSQPEHVTKVS